MASASPRRKELLAELIKDFFIVPSQADEGVDGDPSAKKLVKILAERKAAEVALRAESAGKMVLGSDTVVALCGKVLGKPRDEADAARMLRALSGRKHAVYTGVCIAWTEQGKLRAICGVAKTDVYFNALTEEQIAEYIASGSPMDKAGAYGIQDGGLVEKIKGSFSNVVGLPLELCKKLIRRAEKRVKTR